MIRTHLYFMLYVGVYTYVCSVNLQAGCLMKDRLRRNAGLHDLGVLSLPLPTQRGDNKEKRSSTINLRGKVGFLTREVRLNIEFIDCSYFPSQHSLVVKDEMEERPLGY